MGLLEDTSWRGRATRSAMEAPKVAVVLVFFAGAFAVIAVDSLVRRWRHLGATKRLRRPG